MDRRIARSIRAAISASGSDSFFNGLSDTTLIPHGFSSRESIFKWTSQEYCCIWSGWRELNTSPKSGGRVALQDLPDIMRP